jgi:hypothetical protein
MLSLESLRKKPDEIKAGVSKKKFQCNIDRFLAVDASGGLMWLSSKHCELNRNQKMIK